RLVLRDVLLEDDGGDRRPRTAGGGGRTRALRLPRRRRRRRRRRAAESARPPSAGAHRGASRAAHLDRAPARDQSFRDVVEELRLAGRRELSVAPALLGVREEQRPLGAGDADVEETALLLEQRRVLVGAREREEAVLEPGDEDERKLEPLGV